MLAEKANSCSAQAVILIALSPLDWRKQERPVKEALDANSKGATNGLTLPRTHLADCIKGTVSRSEAEQLEQFARLGILHERDMGSSPST